MPDGVEDTSGGGGFGPLEVIGFFAGLPSALYLGWRLRTHA